MSSVFGLKMENYQGDLNDIVRASGHPSDIVPQVSWQQFPSDPFNFSSPSAMEDHRAFGDPFSAVRDPLDLLHELDNVIATGSGSSSTYFSSPNSTNDHHHHHHHMINMEDQDTSNFSAANNTTTVGGVVDDMTSPINVFSRIQISQPPCDPPEMSGGGGGHKAPAVFPRDMSNVKSCLNIDNTASVPVQISSPRNLGIKRRKSQAKKVVCIPAPAAANTRSSGAVVPSDLWAWRKYGQKPIKGSPFPRGYYRCSSSKGCSARKQVERSGTDPNMLVITYTSEHNHPWPTQRNALAGSTRSQPSKTHIATTGSPSNCQPQNSNESSATATNTSVKEEMEMEDHEAEFGEGIISQTYRPSIILPDSSQQQHCEDNFFADLDEIEITDPSNLLFQTDDEIKENKPMDPFSDLYDWSGNNSF